MDSIDRIKAHKVSRPDRPMEIKVSSEQIVPDGLEFKSRIFGEMDSRSGKTARRVRLVERGHGQNQEWFIELGQNSYKDNWLLFKKAGLPVVPTLRETDRNTVLVTDVTADGSALCGKAFFIKSRENREDPYDFS